MLLIGKGVEPLRGRMMQNSEDVSLHDLDSIDRCLSCYLLPRRWELLPDSVRFWVISGHVQCTRRCPLRPITDIPPFTLRMRSDFASI